MTHVVEVVEGSSPVVLAAPHVGTWIPDDVLATLNELGRARADTDWHVDLLYRGLLANATTVSAGFSRYLIDANRPPGDESLYPGQHTTGLCPVTDFDGRPIYRAGGEPDADEIERRLREYHTPYHAALKTQLDRVKAIYGLVIVYDCHSVRSRIPYLFEGELSVLNVGTNDGTTCDPELQAIAEDICREAEADGFSWVINGRFKGGWTTRHYGQPDQGVHAIQMELAQRAFLDERPPWTFLPQRAARLQAHLTTLLTRLDGWAREMASRPA